MPSTTTQNAVLQALAAGPARMVDLVARTQMPRGTIGHALNALLARHAIARTGTVYSLPDAPAPAHIAPRPAPHTVEKQCKQAAAEQEMADLLFDGLVTRADALAHARDMTRCSEKCAADAWQAMRRRGELERIERYRGGRQIESLYRLARTKPTTNTARGAHAQEATR